MSERITLAGGAPEQNEFDSYQFLRIDPLPTSPSDDLGRRRARKLRRGRYDADVFGSGQCDRLRNRQAMRTTPSGVNGVTFVKSSSMCMSEIVVGSVRIRTVLMLSRHSLAAETIPETRLVDLHRDREGTDASALSRYLSSARDDRRRQAPADAGRGRHQMNVQRGARRRWNSTGTEGSATCDDETKNAGVGRVWCSPTGGLVSSSMGWPARHPCVIDWPITT